MSAEAGLGSVPKLSIIIISYNTREMTLACLRSVFAETRDVPFEIIVVDNNSPDGSAKAIAEAFPNIRLMAERDNHGFALGNNIAAREAKGEFLLLLNPDTVVLDRAIDRLMGFAAERPQAGIWGGRTVFADGSLNPASCWQRITLWNLVCRASGLAAIFSGSEFFNPEAFGGWQRDSVRQVDIVSGCFFLLRRELWERLGGFSPEFFMYGEEADLCLRARAFGVRPHITPEATIIHYGGASETVRADKTVRLLKAKVHLIRRHWSHFASRFGVLLLAAWPLSRLIALSVLSRLRPTAPRTESLETWKKVWASRDEWLRGYA
ncbi:MAG: glycosyltransferase family 2 protein [Parvibaculum sp.]|uniref:glycosyltransferase family 2 protein n=1 Tax=Parvibaculum sp. TaxID=2024848 RepID=UPI002847C2CC|nr:glycosyltransferase family 2 protein [Parvibaculum sp.]MDR3499400.1 glycosyltransferase family 2 protein [Parvibaculum sp.]